MVPRHIGWILKVALLAFIAALLLKGADLDAVRAGIAHIPPRIYAMALLLFAASVALQAWRWKILLREPDILYRECYALTGLGVALAMVSPSIVLADAAVGYWMGKRAHILLRAFSALAASRLMGAAAGFLIFLAALPTHFWVFRSLRLEGTPHTYLLLAAAGLALLAASLLAWRHRRRLGEIRDLALPVLKRPGAMAACMALSLAVQLLQMGVYWLGYGAIGAPVDFRDIVFFTPLIAFFGMAPITIGGMGVREGLGIFFYTVLPGVDREAVLAQAGFWYLALAGMAAINLAVAAVVLGLPGKRPRSAPALP